MHVLRLLLMHQVLLMVHERYRWITEVLVDFLKWPRAQAVRHDTRRRHISSGVPSVLAAHGAIGRLVKLHTRRQDTLDCLKVRVPVQMTAFPEHVMLMRRAGWRRQQVLEAVHRQFTRRPPAHGRVCKLVLRLYHDLLFGRAR